MGNKFQVEVNESVAELKHRLRHAITSSTQERVQMLYWIKQGAIVTRKELAQKLDRDESTIYRWLKRYRQGGLSNLLDVKTPPGKNSKISAGEMNQLKERLSQGMSLNAFRLTSPDRWSTSRIQKLWRNSRLARARTRYNTGLQKRP